MKVKNQIIVALANLGGASLTAGDIEATHAYKVIKFRRAVKSAFDEIAEKERDIINELGLEIGENGRLQGEDEKIRKFTELQKALYEDESEMDCKTIPYEAWRELQKNNKGLQNPFIEDALEGVLWDAPEE